METAEAEAPRTCRVAIVGAQRQRVAKTVALLRADESRECIATISLLSSTADKAQTDNPKGVPVTVGIEYLPCVATFDAYDDERGVSVRYLSKLEFHGPNGTLVKGKSLVPFFDDIDSAGDNDGEKNPFPGIAAVAIGCGIEREDDVEKIQSFFAALSSCSAQISGGQSGVIIQCLKPNPGYASMKEENEAFRHLSEDEKEELVANGTFGVGKMANFVHEVAKLAIRQRWDKELSEYEQNAQQTYSTKEGAASTDDLTVPELMQSTATHTPNPELTRYACKRCRTALFGEEDLEDPPHGQSLHRFQKKMHKVGYGSAGSCQNHFIAQPLPWMDGCAGVEGKLHCPKCNTKVGHYSWTGAQCSCGTWVTPAIMVPLSKMDEMRPESQNAMVATGSLFVDHCGSTFGSMISGAESH